MRGAAAFGAIAVVACGGGGGGGSTSDAHAEVRVGSSDGGHGGQEAGDARADRRGRSRDAGRDVELYPGVDAGFDAPTFDGPPPTTALVRLAGWSPDAPGLDFCISPHGASAWTAPVLAARLGPGALGHVTITDAGLSADAGLHAVDAASDARSDAVAGLPDAASPAMLTGVGFLRMSPYVALTPGDYDVRVVAAGSADCTAPLLPEIDDLPALVAGSVETLAAVGDTVVAGSDPALSLSVLPDDTGVGASSVALRFVNAVPSVVEVTFASGMVSTANAVPYLAAAQFGSAGVDTDAGALDPNDYLTTAPIADQVWSLINANGGVTTLVAVKGASVAAGRLATVVAVGGESGPGRNDIGILVCTDTPPIVAGEEASCTLYQESALPVCGGC